MLLNRKTKSYSKNFCTHRQPNLQRICKSRGGNKTVQEAETTFSKDENKEKQSKINETQQPKTYLLRHKKNCSEFDSDFNKTSSQPFNINFSHHNPEVCVCSDCTCGRHLCQFHSIKPNLSKNTTYKKDYMKKKPIKNRINISGQYDKLKGSILHLNSTYEKDFNGRTTQIERPKPQDTLKLEGPCQKMTSYTYEFPGHRGNNQYVKPTDRHTRGHFPMSSCSTYAHSFRGHQKKKDEWEKVPDNLRTGSNWFGRTTYSSSFIKPNPEDYSQKCKISEKRQINPDFSHQFETTYRATFIEHKSGICPAKLKLSTKSKGFFSGHKEEFNQDADFKSLDPNFHAFSTSQFKWV